MACLPTPAISVDAWEGELRRLGKATEGEAFQKTRARNDLLAIVEKAKDTSMELISLHGEVTKHWNTTDQRVLGYFLHAPPLSSVLALRCSLKTGR